MFVYQNKAGDICVTFKSNKPVTAPEYIFTIDEVAGTIRVNGSEVTVKPNDVEDAVEDDVVEEDQAEDTVVIPPVVEETEDELQNEEDE